MIAESDKSTQAIVKLEDGKLWLGGIVDGKITWTGFLRFDEPKNPLLRWWERLTGAGYRRDTAELKRLARAAGLEPDHAR